MAPASVEKQKALATASGCTPQGWPEGGSMSKGSLSGATPTGSIVVLPLARVKSEESAQRQRHGRDGPSPRGSAPAAVLPRVSG